MHRLAFVSLLIAAACGSGSHGGSATTPTGTIASAAQNANAMPSGAPLVAPGEHMAYKLALQGVEIATFDLTVGAVTDVNGKQAIVVEGHAKASGLASLVSKVDDKFTSYIDVATGRSLQFHADEYATKSSDREHSVIDIAGRANDVVPVAFHLNEGGPTPEPQKVSKPETWDWNAYLVALRAWEGPPGSATDLEIFRSRWLWHVTTKIHGKEKLVTDLGELPALRFDGHAIKLRRDGTKDPDSDERDFSIWVSDDSGRAPLQVVAKTDYGDIKMKISDYQTGNGTPLRQ